MPDITNILGAGIVPADGDVANQLTALTRRGMVPISVDQYSKAAPTLAMFLANAQPASGGMSQITQPAKFASAVTAQSSDYSGHFTLPNEPRTTYNSMHNLKFMIMPIQMLGVETVIQDEHAIVELAASRYDDVGAEMARYDSTALFENYTDNQQIIGLPGAVDDGTHLVTYGGISRTTQPKWKSYYRSAVTGTFPTRANVFQHIIGTAKNAGGELPNAVFCGLGTWLALQNDFQGQEIMQKVPGDFMARDEANSGFMALSIGGIPVFCDPYCPEGDMWILNYRYLNMYVHDTLGFAQAPYESMLANGQFAYLSAIFSMRELVCIKPSAQGRVTNLSYIS